ncbi:MAG: bifunctional methylenetetrahydrofolate dehydrogenase/methenyltetrahydrofolate cyclohydrolase FolD [Deltaproteobacteria bacterium]|nr:bifunctional methylenetetrahydrofolate dehydrogenase/methenyltetrahydrofolate cyclohydrolase FolD [Deltaproteobacteria bacterium]
MPATFLSGKKLSATIRAEQTERVANLRDQGVVPGLATVLVGNNPASVSYVSAKEKACTVLGMASFQRRLPEDTSEQELIEVVSELNVDQRVHGILVQLPLPGHMDADRIISAIDPDKDVDGFHPVNLGRLLAGQPLFVPCTPLGILELLKRAEVELSGADVVIVGRSNIVGKPLAALLMQKGVDATVTVCHSRTKDLAAHTRRANVLIAAVGRPATIGADMVRPGAVVIDVGVNRVGTTASGKAKLRGDVDQDAVFEVASMITPVPGGVGPMTITMLMENTIQAASRFGRLVE